MRDREPFEIVKVGLPVLLEAVVVTIMIACAMALVIIYATPVTP